MRWKYFLFIHPHITHLLFYKLFKHPQHMYHHTIAYSHLYLQHSCTLIHLKWICFFFLFCSLYFVFDSTNIFLYIDSINFAPIKCKREEIIALVFLFFSYKAHWEYCIFHRFVFIHLNRGLYTFKIVYFTYYTEYNI